MKTIIHTVYIRAAPSVVYAALTTEIGLSGWWTKEVSVEPELNGLVRLTFRADFHPHMQQTALEPDRRVEWTCVAGHANWQDNTFTFTLDARDGHTLLKFVQEYLQELSDETYGIYNFNWGYYLNSLKRLCETGSGTPFVLRV